MRYLPGAILSLLSAFCLPSTPAQTFTVLHSFQSSDGSGPQAGVIQDSSGNLYGTAVEGGAWSEGTVFKLTPKGKFSVLHSFGATSSDGSGPFAPLLLDNNGNLYGTTLGGGDDCIDGETVGCGTVFKINSSGKESIIHDFEGGDPSSTDGMTPFAGLIADNNSNAMYGTTWGGYNGGVVYQITPSGKETILYTYQANDTTLYGPLVQDAHGDLWGTTGGGGGDRACEVDCGSVFKLHKTSKGWVETTTYSFAGGVDGANPWAGLVYDPVRHVFYGVTVVGGANQTCYYEAVLGGCGVLFKLDSTGTQLTVLHSFNGTTDGKFPTANLILDPAGNVYGTTSLGGPGSGSGTVFAYTTGGQFITLHTFTGGADGSGPEGSLLLDRKKAVIYGTTVGGGDPTCQCGIVFSIAP
jgi:uncharacterized repeat protein (TIGR03803 family)